MGLPAIETGDDVTRYVLNDVHKSTTMLALLLLLRSRVLLPLCSALLALPL